MTNKWEKTVLVAGIRNTNANFIERLRKMFLRVSHDPDDGPSNKVLERDFLILCTDNISHGTRHKALDFYKSKNLPVLMAHNGWSGLKDELEDFIFGPGVLKILRQPSEYTDGRAGPLTNRLKFYWLLARFYDKGEKIRLKDFTEKTCHVTAIELEACRLFTQSGLSGGKRTGQIEEAGRGYFIWHGLIERNIDDMKQVGLPCDEQWLMTANIKRTAEETFELRTQTIADVTAEPVPEVQPTSILKNINDQHEASMDLLLEAMSQQQKQIEHLKVYIEKSIPAIIQHEIRGITKLLGNLVPQLQGLNPDQMDKVQQMLTLFLGMNKDPLAETSRSH